MPTQYKITSAIKQLACAAIIITVVAGDGHAVDTQKPMNGFYLGAHLGYSDYSITGFAETFPPTYAAHKKSALDIQGSSLFSRLSGGYGHWFEDRFIGVELGKQALTTAEKYRVTATPEHQVDVSYGSRFDISLLVGHRFYDSDLLYGRIGMAFTDVVISPHDVGGLGGAFHDLYGLFIGAGYSHMLQNQLGIRVEWTHLPIDDDYNNDKDDDEIYDVSIRDSQLSIGVFYQF